MKQAELDRLEQDYAQAIKATFDAVMAYKAAHKAELKALKALKRAIVEFEFSLIEPKTESK